MTPVRTRVVLDAMEVTAPIPRLPRRPETVFVSKRPRGRHRKPGRRSLPRSMSGTTAALLLVGSLAALFAAVLLYGLLILSAMPDLSSPASDAFVPAFVAGDVPTLGPFPIGGW